MNTCNYKWIIDCVASTLASPRWEAEVLSFIDEKCIIFDNEEENQLQYTQIHQDFVVLVDAVLRERLLEFGINEKEFVNACLLYNEENKLKNEKKGDNNVKKVDNNVIDQIYAMADFQGFKIMMLNRNIELQIEAMDALQYISGSCKQMLDKFNFDSDIKGNEQERQDMPDQGSSDNELDDEVKKVPELLHGIDTIDTVMEFPFIDKKQSEEDETNQHREFENKDSVTVSSGSDSNRAHSTISIYAENEQQNVNKATLDLRSRQINECQIDLVLNDETIEQKQHDSSTNSDLEGNMHLHAIVCSNEGKPEVTTYSQENDNNTCDNSINSKCNIDIRDNLEATQSTLKKPPRDVEPTSQRLKPKTIVGLPIRTKNNDIKCFFSTKTIIHNKSKYEAMKRHQMFMKTKLFKAKQEDTNDRELKKRGDHLRRQRDMLVQKRNEKEDFHRQEESY
jgi:hypothetical protein